MCRQNIINYLFAFVLLILVIKVFFPNYESFDSLVISDEDGNIKRLDKDSIGKDISIQLLDKSTKSIIRIAENGDFGILNGLNVSGVSKFGKTENLSIDPGTDIVRMMVGGELDFSINGNNNKSSLRVSKDGIKVDKLSSQQTCIGDTWCDDSEWGHPVYLGLGQSYMVLDIDNDKAVMPNRRDKSIQYQIKYLYDKSTFPPVLHTSLYNTGKNGATTRFYIRRVSDGKYITGGNAREKVTMSSTPYEWSYEYDQLVDPLTKQSIHHHRLYNNDMPKIIMYNEAIGAHTSVIFFMPVF